jgi:phosphoribosyl-dephospho-CoA transferase
MPPDPATATPATPAEPAPHALLRVTDLSALVWNTPRPDWVVEALQRAPWVVVRRAAPRPAMWPVGVRGGRRSQRVAAWLPDCAVQDCITPQMLAAKRAWRQRSGIAATRAVAVLDEVAAILAALGHAGRWGPGGSVGFELASGVPTTTSGSDLDLVLRADQPMAQADAIRLHAELSRLPVPIDLLLETPYGGVSLADYSTGASLTLLRSAQGPRLVRDPWHADSTAAMAASIA